MRKQFKAAALILAAATALPVYAARGRADFTTLVALGDSFGVGVSSVGANIAHQRNSWPAVIARQVGLRTDCVGFDAPNCFQIPYISEPGILPELQLLSISPLSITLKPGLGAPINSGLGRSYNNLSVDGAEIGDALAVDGDGNEALSAPIVLRGLGSMTDQALRLNPTFIVMWLGGDDAFNGASSGDPANMTPLDTFRTQYAAVLDKLIAGAPNAGFVVGNLPTDIHGIPFVSLIPPVLLNPATNQPVIFNGQPIPLIADLGGGTIGQLPQQSLVLLTALSLIQTGYGIPAALKPIIDPNGLLPNLGKPLPASQVLTPTEVSAVNQRLVDYNAAISSLAAARNIPVVDINALFARVKAGIHAGPLTFNANFVSGGIFSYDGYHLTDIGYTLFANEYIKTINANYGTRIPLASIAPFLSNNDPNLVSSSSFPTFDAAAAKVMNFAVPAAPSRRRVVIH